MVWILPKHKAYSDGSFPQYWYITHHRYHFIFMLLLQINEKKVFSIMFEHKIILDIWFSINKWIVIVIAMVKPI